MPKKANDGLMDNAIGHNSNQDTEMLAKSYLERLARIKQQQIELRAQQKEILQEGKDGGLLKMALRKAVDELFRTEEQRQAHEEVRRETAYYIELGGQLAMFGPDAWEAA